MKTLRKKSIHIFCIFLMSVIFQSCLVYKKPPIPLAEATNTSVLYSKKVKTIDGRVFHLRTLAIRNNQAFGSTTKKGEIKKLGFSVDEIESIRLQNKELSDFGNVLIVASVLSLVAWLLWVEFGPKFEFGSFFTGP